MYIGKWFWFVEFFLLLTRNYRYVSGSIQQMTTQWAAVYSTGMKGSKISRWWKMSNSVQTCCLTTKSSNVTALLEAALTIIFYHNIVTNDNATLMNTERFITWLCSFPSAFFHNELHLSVKPPGMNVLVHSHRLHCVPSLCSEGLFMKRIKKKNHCTLPTHHHTAGKHS